jgi:hypothetical protein
LSFQGVESTGGGARLAVLLGFVLLSASVAGTLAAGAGLPRMTGFILVRIAAGPSVLSLLPAAAVADVRLGGAAPAVRKRAWQGLISQGGVSLGLVLLIQESLSELGAAVVSLAMAVIIGNTLGGPVLLGRALAAVGGEDGETSG